MVHFGTKLEHKKIRTEPTGGAKTLGKLPDCISCLT